MKRKIIIGLSIFSLLSLVSGLFVTKNILDATAIQDNLIKLHQVEILREHLLIQIRRAQADLYLQNTRHAQPTESVLSHVKTMTDLSNVCFRCHHEKSVELKLIGLRKHIEEFKESIIRVVSGKAQGTSRQQDEDNAFQTGQDLVTEVNDMINFSNMRLGEKTASSAKKIAHSKFVVVWLVGLGPLFVIVLAIIFLRGFTRPVRSILEAIRILKSGNLQYRIEGLKNEFGEVAASFNEMACALDEQMQKMQRAEQLNLVGEMAASIAHEVKNPIAGVKIALQMLSDNKNLSSSESEIVQASFTQIKRMESLLKHVLDYARPRNPEFRFVNVNTLVEKTVSFIETVAMKSRKSDNVKVLKILSPDIPDVLLDPMQIEQAVMNIVLNAFDVMPGGGTLRLETSSRNGSLVLSVSDSGPGIDKGNLDRIFKPFHTTKKSGTGLGLPITKGIVERHGGTISVESKIGEGTTVTMTLPIAHGDRGGGGT